METKHYIVTKYIQDRSRVIVAFASAGNKGGDEPIEEFKKTLLKTGTSAIFVISKFAAWYNHEETSDLLNTLSEETLDFEFSGSIGESMGGSGALMLGFAAPHLNRILSFAPPIFYKTAIY